MADAKREEAAASTVHTNPDLSPIPPSQRTLSAFDMAWLWVGLVTGITQYYFVASLVQEGMSWWQGILTVIVGSLITLAATTLTAYPGTLYGIPFPILARSAFGINGAHLPTLLRSLISCGWFGIETWIGGQAFYIILPSSVKNSSFGATISWLDTSPLELTCFFAFWAAQLAIVWKGMDGIRYMEKYSCPILIVLIVSLLCWAYVRAGGFGRMFSLPSRLTNSEFWSLFFPSLTASIWASISLNIPDFSRYAKSQTDQVLGQAGLPLFIAAVTFVGLAITSSTEVIFGHVVSNPITLLGEIGGVLSKVLRMVGIVLAVLTTNIPANVVAPANALVNLSPTHFSFWRGALLTAVVGILYQPWRIFASSNSFVYTWLVGLLSCLWDGFGCGRTLLDKSSRFASQGETSIPLKLWNHSWHRHNVSIYLCVKIGVTGEEFEAALECNSGEENMEEDLQAVASKRSIESGAEEEEQFRDGEKEVGGL
ncbi:hypothetical protein MRB53_032614 [Persea americana]|uniref:Uncharacterized protein n=1 Tax=Persea americana TaxID=3435 RepID=A0ACC2KSA1_PERAE|nr:hypothetical protein MRB53_032614 [Persea americana]